MCTGAGRKILQSKQNNAFTTGCLHAGIVLLKIFGLSTESYTDLKMTNEREMIHQVDRLAISNAT